MPITDEQGVKRCCGTCEHWNHNGNPFMPDCDSPYDGCLWIRRRDVAAYREQIAKEARTEGIQEGAAAERKLWECDECGEPFTEHHKDGGGYSLRPDVEESVYVRCGEWIRKEDKA